jgi:hypothetical protein
VPVGKALFFPIVNAVGFDESELRADANGLIDLAHGLEATVDGRPVDVYAYRAESPLFQFTLPEGNIVDPALDGQTFGGVDAGYYLLLHPLPPGSHTIEFRGEIVGSFATHVVYNLSIGVLPFPAE